MSKHSNRCTNCDGDGIDPLSMADVAGDLVPCPVCGGTGTVGTAAATPKPNRPDTTLDCGPGACSCATDERD